MTSPSRRSTPWLRFLLVGIASVGVDTTVLVLLREVVATPLWLATTGAFTAALGVNFSLNMRWVFGARGQLPLRLFRYGLLVALNYVLTLVLVLGLAAAGMHYLLGKWIAIGLAALVNYLAYRRWVFI